MSKNFRLKLYITFIFCCLLGLHKIKASDFNSLPEEITVEVFSFLRNKDLDTTSLVCKKWNSLTQSPKLKGNHIRETFKLLQSDLDIEEIQKMLSLSRVAYETLKSIIDPYNILSLSENISNFKVIAINREDHKRKVVQLIDTYLKNREVSFKAAFIKAQLFNDESDYNTIFDKLICIHKIEHPRSALDEVHPSYGTYCEGRSKFIAELISKYGTLKHKEKLALTFQ